MNDRRLVNLCFHGVGIPARDLDQGEAGYWISVDLFRRVLDLVVDRSDVRLSFDDGNASDVGIALPELLDRGLRAEFFPIADRIGRAGSLDGDDIRQLVAAGMPIGSHGLHHVPWRGLPDEALTGELVLARDLIARESRTAVTRAACPLGRYDRRVLHRLRRLGYRRVYTSDRTVASAGSWLQPRFSLRDGDTAASAARLLDTRPSRRQRVEAGVRVLVKRLR